MTIFNPRMKMVDANGQPSAEFQQFMASLLRDLAKVDAIAGVTAPTGGATVDTQARTAINAIIAAAS